MNEVQRARVDKIMALAEVWRIAGCKEEHAIREDHLRGAIEALLEQPEPVQEPASLKRLAATHGIKMPETYIPTMDEAIAAGNSVLMSEQAALLRECRAALDSLISQKPTFAGLLCGSTTLGNLRAELGVYRPQGVFGAPEKGQP
jgi:hypothetical protein